VRLGAMYVDSNLGFTKEEGSVLPPWKVWQHFARLLQLSGPPRFPFHALRHTAATLML
jgi:integrase